MKSVQSLDHDLKAVKLKEKNLKDTAKKLMFSTISTQNFSPKWPNRPNLYAENVNLNNDSVYQIRNRRGTELAPIASVSPLRQQITLQTLSKPSFGNKKSSVNVQLPKLAPIATYIEEQQQLRSFKRHRNSLAKRSQRIYAVGKGYEPVKLKEPKLFELKSVKEYREKTDKEKDDTVAQLMKKKSPVIKQNSSPRYKEKSHLYNSIESQKKSHVRSTKALDRIQNVLKSVDHLVPESGFKEIMMGIDVKPTESLLKYEQSIAQLSSFDKNDNSSVDRLDISSFRQTPRQQHIRKKASLQMIKSHEFNQSYQHEMINPLTNNLVVLTKNKNPSNRVNVRVCLPPIQQNLSSPRYEHAFDMVSSNNVSLEEDSSSRQS